MPLQLLLCHLIVVPGIMLLLLLPLHTLTRKEV